jgi:hypothetical protein
VESSAKEYAFTRLSCNKLFSPEFAVNKIHQSQLPSKGIGADISIRKREL